MNTLIEAWYLTNGMKWPIYKRVLITILLVILAPLLLVRWLILLDYQINMNIYLLMVFIFSQLVTIIIGIQMLMIGVRQSIGLPLNIKKIDSELMAAKWELVKLIVLLMVLTTIRKYIYPLPNIEHPALKYIILSFMVNFIFLIVYLPIFIFAIPDVITRKKTAFSALLRAYYSAGVLWKKIISSYGILFLAYFLLIALYIIFMPSYLKTTFTLKILIFILSLLIIPLFFALSGILFRDSYGLKAKRLR